MGDFVKDNEKLIHLVLNRHFPECTYDSPDYQDMVQVGYLALCRCAKLYDEEKGTVSTFTYPSIKREMTKYWFHDRPGLIGGRSGPEGNDYVWFKLESLNREIDDGEGIGEFQDLIKEATCSFEKAEIFDDVKKVFARHKNGKRVFDGLTRGFSQTEIADRLGFSRQLVSKLIKTCEREYVQMCENQFYDLNKNKGRRRA